MKTTVLAIAAIGEAATGLILSLHPPLVVRLLFGADIAGAGIVMCRIAGLALIGLGVACWTGKESSLSALRGMTSYSALATLYLGYVGIEGQWIGQLLWPAVAGHALLTLLLGAAWHAARTEAGRAPDGGSHRRGSQVALHGTDSESDG